MERKYPPHSILTYTGRIVVPFKLRECEVNIRDIGKSLSHQGRFLGHTRKFYSVAQHCFEGTVALMKGGACLEVAQAFLIHDASEAYMCDIPSPLKHSPVFKEYRKIEKQVERTIYTAMGIENMIDHPVVKMMDKSMLLTEKRDLINTHDRWTEDDSAKPLRNKLVPKEPHDAYISYLSLAGQLFGDDNEHIW